VSKCKRSRQSRLVYGSSVIANRSRNFGSSYLTSPYSWCVSRTQNVFSSILVTIMVCLAFWAIPFTYIQRQLLGNETTTIASFAGWEKAIDQFHFFTTPVSFVFQHSSAHTKTSITNTTSQFAIGHHVAYTQVFNSKHIKSTYKIGCEFI